ncbi:MAG: heavy-metal-associated domain-containing protein, partial [Anaerolineae bacterium]|nr:heavy-metal-associated domain-containing protein [Anaerolineae bacterium]
LQSPQSHAENPDMARPLSTAAPQSISIKGDMLATMEKLQFNIPGMWADHHVLKVRNVLTGMAGVQDVVASSAFRMVALNYDPAVVTPEQIAAALASAGYPISTNGTDVVAETVPIAAGKRDPAWYRLGLRQHKTDERDLKTKR